MNVKNPVSRMNNISYPVSTGKGNVVVSWTGGKDGCYSCYKAMAEGYRVTHLLNFRNVTKRGAHEMNPAIIRAQAEATGIPVIQRDTVSYEQEFSKVIRELREQGAKIDGAVFGHIETHKPLVDRLCRELDLEQLLPLWKQDSKKILMEMIAAGFEMVVLSARDGLPGREWLGRKIDGEFIRDLERLDKSIDPCGENGEFHSLVTDCPLFRKKIQIIRSDPKLQDNYWYMEISGFSLQEK